MNENIGNRRAQARIEYGFNGFWDKYGEHNPTDSEDYGYFMTEGKMMPQPRSELYAPALVLGEEEKEEELYFRGLREEKEAEREEERKETELAIKALKAAWDAMSPEEQEAARRKANQRIAEKNLAASRDESREYAFRRHFFEEAVRRGRQGAHLDLTEEEQRSAEEIKRKWEEER